MSQPPIVFSHGNSFPANTYRRLFERWQAAGHAVHAVEKFGHDPAYPVTSNWPHLRNQLIHFIEREVQGPAVLVGHSLGGILSLLAACRRPELALGLVLLDSPIVGGWRAGALKLVKHSGLMRRVSPGKVARARRDRFASRQEALAHYARKPVFQRWDPRVLQDYVDCGTVQADGGLVLAFDREVEGRIYDTLPDHLDRVLRLHPPQCPVGFIAGTESVEMRQGGSDGARALARERFQTIEGGHLYPMERPDETAERVLQLIAGFPASRGRVGGTPSI
jgi:pimeloyl-ACP methyl ester carboxylesterase